MIKKGSIIAATLLVIGVLTIPLMSNGHHEPAQPVTHHDDLIEFEQDGTRITRLPVLYKFCGLPLLMVEQGEGAVKHYTGEVLKRRLKEIYGKSPLLILELTDSYPGLTCKKESVPAPNRQPVPENGPARMWSA